MSNEISAPPRRQAGSLPPLEVLDELLDYNPETGIFRWKKRVGRNGRIPAGTITGTPTSAGYLVIRFGGRLYLSHRLAFYMFHRREPFGMLDHDDGHKDNNRISNLQEATNLENGWNMKMRSSNKSGVKGVSWHSRCGKWVAWIRGGGKQIYLGLFENIEDAATVVRAAREKLHGKFANHG